MKIELLIEKYDNELRNMTIMDDYDGGAANQLRKVIDDLRKLDRTKFSKGWYKKEVKKSEKTS
jgi:hypothetical protein